MQQRPFDLIIVGTGTAGAILAARIAQHGRSGDLPNHSCQDGI